MLQLSTPKLVFMQKMLPVFVFGGFRTAYLKYLSLPCFSETPISNTLLYHKLRHFIYLLVFLNFFSSLL